MNKLAVFSVSVLLFIEFGIKSLLLSLSYYYMTLESGSYSGLLVFWGVLVNFGLLIGLIGIFNSKLWAKNLFFSIVFTCLLLNISDYVVGYLNDDLTHVRLPDVLETLVFPVFSLWVVQFSDAKEFFKCKVN